MSDTLGLRARAVDTDDADVASEPIDGVPLGRVRLAVLLFGLGVLVAVGAQVLTDVVALVLPGRAEVRSLGTAVGSFTEIAPSLFRRLGIGTAAVGIVVGIAARIPDDFTLTTLRWWRPVSSVVVVVGTGAWYGWLGQPHNGFPTNARIHWVDYLTWNSDNYFYAAGRLPHLVFYDQPWLWQAINAGAVAAVLLVIARQLSLGPIASLGLAATPAIAGNLLLFADTAEDVLLNVLLLLLVVVASLSGRPGWIGVAVAFATLGRPSFLSLLVAVVAADALLALRRTRSIRRAWEAFDVRAAAVTVSAALGVTAGAQLLFTVLGERYLLVGGSLIDVGPLARAEPQNVDGFTISAFSGAYVSHFVWMIPVTILVAAVAAVVCADRFRRRVEATVYMCAFATAIILIVHESQPLLYYNARYVTYTVPFVVVAAWVWLAPEGVVRRPVGRLALGGLLIAGAFAFPIDPVELKRRNQERPELELLEVRDELRELRDDGIVYLTFGGRSTGNIIVYALRAPKQAVVPMSDVEPAPGSLVISRRSEPWGRGDVVLTTETYEVAIVAEGGAARDG